VAAVSPLGLRCNNPFNLQEEHIPWLGVEPTQAPGGELQFDTLVDGIRAGVKLCYTYQKRGLNSPLKFVTEFSPPSANPTAQYIQNVCEWTGFQFDQILDFHDLATMKAWARAVWRQELGEAAANAITDDQLVAGITLAESE
jgi:hypothetical protein